MALDDYVPFDYPQLLLAGLVIVIAVTLVIGAGTSSASFGVYNQAWDGASNLQEQASAVDTSSVVIRSTSAYTTTPPRGSIAVILSPDSAYARSDVTRIKTFIIRGGTLVIAEDYGSHSNTLLAALGARARLDGRVLRDERYYYRSPAMPIARNIPNHPLAHGVQQVTLNYGTAIRPNNATVVASSSEFAYLDTDRDNELDTTERIATYPVVTVESMGEGRVIVIGDPSILINAMLDRPGNRAFARSLFRLHNRVLLDYSHARGLPPLAIAVLALRESIPLQISVGILGIALVGVWARGSSLFDRFQDVFSTEAREPRYRVSEAELAEILERRYPERDPEQIRRVTKGIISNRVHDEDDE